jgi:hypothetical protein
LERIPASSGQIRPGADGPKPRPPATPTSPSGGQIPEVDLSPRGRQGADGKIAIPGNILISRTGKISHLHAGT